MIVFYVDAFRSCTLKLDGVKKVWGKSGYKKDEVEVLPSIPQDEIEDKVRICVIVQLYHVYDNK